MRFMTLAAAAVVAAAGTAQAGYTGFGGSGETSVYATLVSNYGAASQTQAQFQDPSGAGSATTTFGAYTFTRVNDDGGSTPTDLHALVAPSSNDTMFSDGTTQVRFTVKYAGASNTLGWVDNGTPTAVNSVNFQSILGDTTPGATATVTLSANFQLALRSNTTYWGSNTGTNSDGLDHLMTYFVQGNGRTFYVVTWEDLPSAGADRDYNDWVGELQVVPLPPAAWAGMSTLAGVAGLGVIRRRRLTAI